MVTSLTRLRLNLSLINLERIDVAPLARLTRLTYLELEFTCPEYEDEDFCSITCSSTGSSPGSLPPQLRELHAGDGYLDSSACRALAGLPHLQALTAASLRPSPLDPPICLAGQNMQRLQLDGVLLQDLPALVPCLNRCQAAGVRLMMPDKGGSQTDPGNDGHLSTLTQQWRALTDLAPQRLATSQQQQQHQDQQQQDPGVMELRLSATTQSATDALVAAAVLPRLPRHVALDLLLGSDESEVIKVDGPMAAELAGCSSLSQFTGGNLECTTDFLNGLLAAPLAGLAAQLVLTGTLDAPPGAAPIIMGMCLAQRAAQGLRPLPIWTDLLTREEGRRITSQLLTLYGPERAGRVDGL